MELFYAYEVDGGIARLDAEESGHCVRVLRHRAGDGISVIDGLGSMFRCRLSDDNPKGAVAEVLETFPGWGSHPYHLTLACCPTKNNERFEWFVEKATEVGVDRIVPVIGERSERKVYKTDRAARIALSATKQSLKARIPVIDEPLSVRAFIDSTDKPWNDGKDCHSRTTPTPASPSRTPSPLRHSTACPWNLSLRSSFSSARRAISRRRRPVTRSMPVSFPSISAAPVFAPKPLP